LRAISGRYRIKRNPIEHQSKANPKFLRLGDVRNGKKFANPLFAQ